MSARFFLFFLCSVLAAPIFAEAAWQSTDSIKAAALASVPDLQAPGVEAEAVVDAALRMPSCPVALQSSMTTAGTVEVACRERGWRLYVPVKIRRLTPVLVLAGAVAAGEVLTGQKLRLESRDLTGVGVSALSAPELAIGRLARRAMPAGSLLTATDLVAPRLVRRGDAVTLLVREAGLEIRAPGRALQDAGQDERLMVENVASRRVLTGVLLTPGEVLIR